MFESEDQSGKAVGIRGWLSRLWRGRETSLTSLKLDTGKLDTGSPAASSLPGTGVPPAPPKRYIRFQDPKGGLPFQAHPVQFLKGMFQQQVIQPGSHDPLGNLGIWANDLEVSGTTDWVDDEQDGLFSRKLCSKEDALGARGLLDGVPYVLADILQVGQNVVVYQLTNLNTCAYLAYGFPITELDVRLAFERYLRRIAEKGEGYNASRLIALADRVLEGFPAHEAALFNKGVALLADKRFSEARICFEQCVKLNSTDLLALLHYAAVLGALGEYESAVDQLVIADLVSEEGVRNLLRSFSVLQEFVGLSVSEVLRVTSPGHQVRDLWLKYFPPV